MEPVHVIVVIALYIFLVVQRSPVSLSPMNTCSALFAWNQLP
jgi:hypothetical protein